MPFQLQEEYKYRVSKNVYITFSDRVSPREQTQILIIFWWNQFLYMSSRQMINTLIHVTCSRCIYIDQYVTSNCQGYVNCTSWHGITNHHQAEISPCDVEGLQGPMKNWRDVPGVNWTIQVVRRSLHRRRCGWLKIFTMYFWSKGAELEALAFVFQKSHTNKTVSQPHLRLRKLRLTTWPVQLTPGMSRQFFIGLWSPSTSHGHISVRCWFVTPCTSDLPLTVTCYMYIYIFVYMYHDLYLCAHSGSRQQILSCHLSWLWCHVAPWIGRRCRSRPDNLHLWNKCKDGYCCNGLLTHTCYNTRRSCNGCNSLVDDKRCRGIPATSILLQVFGIRQPTSPCPLRSLLHRMRW